MRRAKVLVRCVKRPIDHRGFSFCIPHISYWPCLGRPSPIRRLIIACHLIAKLPFSQSHHDCVLHCSNDALSTHVDSFQVKPSALIPYKQLLMYPNPKNLLKALSLAYSTRAEWSLSANDPKRRRSTHLEVAEAKMEQAQTHQGPREALSCKGDNILLKQSKTPFNSHVKIFVSDFCPSFLFRPGTFGLIGLRGWRG